MDANPLRGALLAIGRIGARAAAAGVSSVLKDVDRVAAEAQRRVRVVQQGLDQIANDERNR